MAVVFMASCGGEVNHSDVESAQQELSERDHGKMAPEPEAVFSYHKKTGQYELERTEGRLDLDSWHFAARPYDSRALNSGFAWEEGEWFRSDDEGTEQFYHVSKREAEIELVEDRSEIFVEPEVAELISQSAPDEEALVVIRFWGFDIWDVHLKPDPRFLSEEEVSEGLRRRESDIVERKSRYQTAKTAFLTRFPAVTVNDEVWSSGRMLVSIPIRDLSNLGAEDVQSIETPKASTLNACVSGSSCGFSPTSEWRLGQGRSADRIYVEPFHNGGIRGAYPNSARHSYGAMTVGVIDHAWNTAGGFLIGWEDDYLGMRDQSLLRRYTKVWDCATYGTCAYLSGGFPDYDHHGNHGTQVSSVIGADFQLGQADNRSYDDVCWSPPSLSNGYDSSHCAEWERSSSGMAPQAKIIAYGINAVSQQTLHTGKALSQVLIDNPDSVNMSFSFGGPCPTPQAEFSGIDAENAFDDGVFVVNAPDNESGPCTVDSPGNVPKVFTVGALGTQFSACRSNYENCGVFDSPSGGLEARFGSGGSPISGAISAIDLVAPGKLTHLAQAPDYDPYFDIGSIKYVDHIGGTSQAAPHVAGSAVLLKEHFLRFGHSFVNSPGRLHAMMLGMGDRYNGSSYPASNYHTNANTYGFGRLKMRYLTSNAYGLGNPFGWSVQTRTLTPTGGNVSFKPWGTSPIPSNASFLKCTLFEAEDTSDDPYTSDVWLRMTISTPISGSCASSTNPVQLIDQSYDLKHYTSSSAPGGKCVEVELVNYHVSDSSLMTNTFCYYAGVNDREE